MFFFIYSYFYLHFYESYTEITLYDKKFKRFFREQKCGISNSNYYIILKPLYDRIEAVYIFDVDIQSAHNFFICELDGKYGVFDEKGNEIIPIRYSTIIQKSDYFICEKNSKWGIIGQKGEIKIPFEYQSIKYTEDNFFKTKKNNRLGLLDYQLNRLFFEKYNNIYVNKITKDIGEGFGIIKKEIIIGKNDNEAEILDYSDLKRSNRNLNSNVEEKINKYKFDDIKDKSIVKNIPYLFVKRNNKWGIINFKDFTLIQPFIFDDLIPNNNNKYLHFERPYYLGYYKQNNLLGLLGTKGEKLTEAKFLNIELWNEFLVKNSDQESIIFKPIANGTDLQGKHIVIDKYGNQKINQLHGLELEQISEKIRNGEESYIDVY